MLLVLQQCIRLAAFTRETCRSKDCVDCETSWNVNYATVQRLPTLLQCNYTYSSKNCSDSDYLFNAILPLLFGCVNLSGKSYCIFNEQLIKDILHKKIAEVRQTFDLPGFSSI